MPRAKPGGYSDNAALADARRANQRIQADVRLLVDAGERMSTQRLLSLLTRITMALAEQSSALAEMERIRGR